MHRFYTNKKKIMSTILPPKPLSKYFFITFKNSCNFYLSLEADWQQGQFTSEMLELTFHERSIQNQTFTPGSFARIIRTRAENSARWRQEIKTRVYSDGLNKLLNYSINLLSYKSHFKIKIHFIQMFAIKRTKNLFDNIINKRTTIFCNIISAILSSNVFLYISIQLHSATQFYYRQKRIKKLGAIYTLFEIHQNPCNFDGKKIHQKRLHSEINVKNNKTWN